MPSKRKNRISGMTDGSLARKDMEDRSQESLDRDAVDETRKDTGLRMLIK